LCDKTPTKEFRETMAGRGGQRTYPAKPFTGVSSSLKAHLHKPRGAQRCTTAGRSPNQKLLRNDHHVQSPPKKWKK